MSKHFDLEQEIFHCWEVVKDLNILAEQVNNGSNHTDTVNGIAAVYEMRFTKLWDLYESVTEEYFALKKLNESKVNLDEEDEV